MERRRTRRPPQHPGVLVVDGHADTRDLYAETLRSFGFETDTVDEVGMLARSCFRRTQGRSSYKTTNATHGRGTFRSWL